MQKIVKFFARSITPDANDTYSISGAVLEPDTEMNSLSDEEETAILNKMVFDFIVQCNFPSQNGQVGAYLVLVGTTEPVGVTTHTDTGEGGSGGFDIEEALSAIYGDEYQYEILDKVVLRNEIGDSDLNPSIAIGKLSASYTPPKGVKQKFFQSNEIEDEPEVRVQFLILFSGEVGTVVCNEHGFITMEYEVRKRTWQDILA